MPVYELFGLVALLIIIFLLTVYLFIIRSEDFFSKCNSVAWFEVARTCVAALALAFPTVLPEGGTRVKKSVEILPILKEFSHLPTWVQTFQNTLLTREYG